jgi:hypothetical protein
MFYRLTASACITAVALVACATTQVQGAVFATYDAAQHNANGFAFADFNDFFAVDTSGGTIAIDINQDLDAANGLFGGHRGRFRSQHDAT